MTRHASTKAHMLRTVLARQARAQAEYVLVGGLMLLIAIGGWALLKLTDDARVNAEAALGASQVESDLVWTTGLTFQAQLSGYTPVIRADIARRATRVRGNLQMLQHFGLDVEEVRPLTAEANTFLSTLEHRIDPGVPGNPALAGLKALPVDPTTVTHQAESVVSELQQSAANAARPRRLVVLLTLPTVALLVATMLYWDSRRRRHAALTQAGVSSHARFEALVEEGSDLVVLVDRWGLVSYVSSSLPHVLGVEPHTWLGRQGLDLIDPQDQAAVAKAFEAVAYTGRCDPIDARFLHADGTWRLLELTATDLSSNPNVGCVVWHARDVTERRSLEDELARQVFRDSLTGLANRGLFQDRLTQTLARAARSGEQIGVVMLDLDGFKTINDTMGHDAGDEVLVEVAARLAACVRPGDTVARPGGDEFTILLEDMENPPEIEVIAARVVDQLRKPVHVRGHDLYVTVSMGIVLSHDVGDSAHEVLRNAELAMSIAKSKGRNNHLLFEASMQEDAQDAMGLSLDLSRALARAEFFLQYQPTMSLITGKLEGAEALLRWRHPERGVVPPLAFIPLAERSGEIVPIGRWVLEQACEQAATWALRFPDRPPFSMNVNVSGRQLMDPSLIGDVTAVLERTGLAPQALTLEITESIFVNGTDAVVSRLEQLRGLGVKLAIDDFGTGYSSLAYLSRFPFDILKIDKAFVDAASSGAPGGEALIKAIVDIGSGLNLKTVAEGIEQPAQASHMRVLGCDAGQGYLFARPMPAEEFTELLSLTDRGAVTLSQLAAVGGRDRPAVPSTVAW